MGIDTSEVPDDPAATIRKMQVIRRAALAPSEPSEADRRIAAEAQQRETKARMDLQAQQAEEPESGSTRPAGDPSGDNANSATEEASGQDAEADAASAATSAAPSFAAILAGEEAKPVWLQAGARHADREPASSAFVPRASALIGTTVAARSYAAVALAGKRMSTFA